MPGIFEAEVKGVRVALEAVHRLRQRGVPCRLLRISVLPQSEEERRVLPADRFLTAVEPEQVAAELRRSDLLLFTAQAGEGFGLPLLEAMASGLPAVASRLPSCVEMTHGAVPLVASSHAEGFAAAAEPLLTRAPAWRRARRCGLEAVARYAPARVTEELEVAVRWAAQSLGAGEVEANSVPVDSDAAP